MQLPFWFSRRSWRTRVIAAWLLPCLVLFLATAIIAERAGRAHAREVAARDRVNALVDAALQAQVAALLPGEDPVLPRRLTVLFLGLDARKEADAAAHCDAIHFLSLDVATWEVTITSVPRGTPSALPPGGVHAPTDYYLSNACAFGGLEYGVAQIEHIAGIRADARATLGFSRAQGAFRLLGLPPTETLQWVRNRHSYAIGDPQRSHNQGVFLRDMMIRLMQGERLPDPLLYLLYRSVDTTLSFADVRALYDAARTGLAQDPAGKIHLVLRPEYPVIDVHFDPEHASEQIAALLAPLQGRLSPQDLSGRSVESLQEELVAYGLHAATTGEGLAHAVEQRLWRQVQDPATRDDLAVRLVERAIVQDCLWDPTVRQDLLLELVWEMEALGSPEGLARARDLFARVTIQDVCATVQ